jgi:hypothetical protein
MHLKSGLDAKLYFVMAIAIATEFGLAWALFRLFWKA